MRFAWFAWFAWFECSFYRGSFLRHTKVDETETLAEVGLCSLILFMRYASGTTTYDERTNFRAAFARISASSSDHGYLNSYENPSLVFGPRYQRNECVLKRVRVGVHTNRLESCRFEKFKSSPSTAFYCS